MLHFAQVEVNCFFVQSYKNIQFFPVRHDFFVARSYPEETVTSTDARFEILISKNFVSSSHHHF